MNRFLAVVVLLGMTGCSLTQPYLTNISPAGEQGILVEKCKVQFNSLVGKISTEDCNTSYVWLGGKTDIGKDREGKNNVITIK